jgi:pyruvate dehydrogenase E2 component (dihydrolipoamide acetyltransferase)
MPIVDVLVPQLGEGLQEVLVQKLLKMPGEFVRRDEPFYIMETDKADFEVESPYAGILKEWLVEEGGTLAVGALIARIEESETGPEVNGPSARAAVTPMAALASPSARSMGPEEAHTTPEESRQPVPRVFVPPRTRAYCRTLAISDDEVGGIPSATDTLMPADVDRYLAMKSGPSPQGAPPAKADRGADSKDHPLLRRQRVFNFRLKCSAQLVVPGTMVRELDWERLEQAVKGLRRQNPGLHSSEFQTFAYALVQAAGRYPEFRSVLVGETIVRQFEHLNLGIAVQRPGAELLTAVVPKAETLDFRSFAQTIHLKVRQAMKGEDQVDDRVPLHLNDVSRLGITHGTSVLVAPAVAVVFLGAPTRRGPDRTANLGVTFDHRLINGVTAANLLADIVRQIHRFGAEDP